MAIGRPGQLGIEMLFHRSRWGSCRTRCRDCGVGRRFPATSATWQRVPQVKAASTFAYITTCCGFETTRLALSSAATSWRICICSPSPGYGSSQIASHKAQGFGMNQHVRELSRRRGRQGRSDNRMNSPTNNLAVIAGNNHRDNHNMLGIIMADIPVYLKIFIAIYVLVNPLEGIPVFLAKTQRMDVGDRKMVARVAA